MNRLGVFVFYDKEGIADRYIFYLLKALHKSFTKLIIVVNGFINDESLSQMRSFSDDIFIRENKGYDAGAYKDVFAYYISAHELKAYDQIVLFNDSIFGPLCSMENMWTFFERNDMDFGGITKHPFFFDDGGNSFPSHIQSYFLVVNNKMFTSRLFTDFWCDMSYPVTLYDAVSDFELKFTDYFEKAGFVGKTLISELKYDGNPYGLYIKELIQNYDMPFFKTKCLAFTNPRYFDAIDAVKYIEKKSDYNTKLIWEHIYRECYKFDFSVPFSYAELQTFYEKHMHCYIYGNGQYGKVIQAYFLYRNWNIKGVVVSDGQIQDGNEIYYSDVELDKNDGIIVALGKKNLGQVINQISKDLGKDQMLLPRFIAK